jgi:hypothetical protein
MESICADELELRPSNRVLLLAAVVLAVSALRLGVDVVWPRDRVVFVAGCVGSAFVVAGLVLGLTVAVRTRAEGWRLRLDAAGVTVRGHETVPWSDLAEVRLAKPRRRSLALFVSFIPGPGVSLPTVPTSWPLSRLRSRIASLTRRFGSPIVVNTLRMGVSADQIAAAVQRLSDIPVVRD